MNSTATNISCSCWIRGLPMLWFIAISFLCPSRLCHAQITSFEYAYDRLLSEVFYNEPADTQIFGNPKQIDGTVNIKTFRGEIMVGKGPGWVFYFADDSRQITLHNVVLVSTSGKVTRKVLKEKPLELDDYVTMDRPRMAEMRAEVALTSEKEAYDWLIHKLLGHTVGDRRIYVYPEKLENEVIVETPKKRIELGNGPGWLFFIDDLPLANWAHRCRYVLVTVSGEMKVQAASWPPNNFSHFREMTSPFSGPPYNTDRSRSEHFRPNENIRRFASRATPAANRWAVIISGGGNSTINHDRYWNDCALFYETLIDHDFLDDHIFVLISDGTNIANDRNNDTPGDNSDNTSSPLDLDGDGDNDINFSATVANITNVFNNLAANLDDDDILYIFTTNHGDHQDICQASNPFQNPDVELTLWNNTSITDVALAQLVNNVTTRVTVCIMEQCFSGGMLDELFAPNRVLMSAARFWEVSWPGNVDGGNYDEWSYYVTHALANPDDADTNGDRIVSMEEAYLYALAHDTLQSEDLSGGTCGDNLGEHPCYYSNPWDLGRMISLYGIQEYIPYNPLMAKYSQTTGYTQTEVQDAFPKGGTARGWKADDNFWLCNLPFNFPYGGQTYSGVWVGSNGIVYLNNPGSGNDNENSVNGLIGRNAIAPLWDDLMTVQTGDDIFTSSSGKWFTIRWRAHTVPDATPRPVNVALKISSDGAIRFLYGAGNDHTSRIEQRDKTIGISMGNGLYHLSLRNGAWDLGNANTIEYLPYTAIYVDGVHSGAELGTKELPYNTVSEGYNAITNYGALVIKGGSYAGNQNVPITLRKPIRIINYQGPAIIGRP